jgi:putative inorganic carbon (hco3(-)) transporter
MLLSYLSKTWVVFLILLLGSIMISFVVGTRGYVAGGLIFAVFAGLPLLYKSITDTRFGFYFLTWYSYFLFCIGRLFLPAKLPMGIGVEALEIVLLCGILISEFGKKSSDWSYFNNPITYLFILLETYNVLQAFNPSATSLAGWVVSTRGIVFDLLIYFILGKLFSDFELVKKYTKLWLFFSFLAALYGIYQEIFGYNDLEWLEINTTPGKLALIQNWAFLRKFSFLSDVATFGIVMAYSGIFCAVLAMHATDWKRKILLLGCAMLMFVSMSFSGTRTATAMVPAGAFMYILMSINNRRTIVILAGLIVGFVVLLYGPFYGGTISRIRSTFQPSQDASMSVREYNRARAQPYIRAHPIGGGVNTTDAEGEALSPGHQLAGFPTDSGFLKTALTIGWVGLIIVMAFYFVVITTGVKNYYRARDPVVRALYGAYIAAFFSLIVANYTQPALGQKPTGLIVFSIFILMPNLIKLDKSLKL